MNKNTITLHIHRANGRSSTIRGPLNERQLTAAEALLEYLTTGVNPHERCGSCGRHRDDHAVRHVFVEPV